MPGCRSAATSASALQAHLAGLLNLGGLGVTKPTEGSLAQRLGLVPGPPPPLSATAWVQVHLQSRLRQDSHGDCAICRHPFRAEGQVLLSCSHTFHQTCLASFERALFGRQAQRCCPLCRCQAYEKRRIEDGERAWRHTCAARIQAAWRGHAARRAFRALRRLLPPKHPALRRRWAAEQLGESSARLAACVEQAGSDIDALFAELDATAAAAGAAFAALSSRRPPPSGGAAGAHDSGTSGLGGVGAAEAARQGPSSPAAASQAAPEPSRQLPPQQAVEQGAAVALPLPQDWEAVLSRCLQRDEQPECPICLAPLAQPCTGGSNGSARGGGGRSPHSPSPSGPAHSCRRQQQQPQPQPQQQASGIGSAGVPGAGLAVLSCSHAFHADCLSAFEAFSIASELPAACPCCRSAYARLDLC